MAERSVRKKTEKLQKCTRELEKELDDLEHRYKKAKKEVQEEADAAKAEFLRQAAILQRRVDESNQELQRQQDEIAKDEPLLQELRNQLAQLLEEQRERREILENDKSARIRALHDEIRELELAET